VAIAIARIKFGYEEIRKRLEKMDEKASLPPPLPPSLLSFLYLLVASPSSLPPSLPIPVSLFVLV